MFERAIYLPTGLLKKKAHPPKAGEPLTPQLKTVFYHFRSKSFITYRIWISDVIKPEVKEKPMPVKKTACDIFYFTSKALFPVFFKKYFQAFED